MISQPARGPNGHRAPSGGDQEPLAGESATCTKGAANPAIRTIHAALGVTSSSPSLVVALTSIARARVSAGPEHCLRKVPMT